MKIYVCIVDHWEHKRGYSSPFYVGLDRDTAVALATERQKTLGDDHANIEVWEDGKLVQDLDHLGNML